MGLRTEYTDVLSVDDRDCGVVPTLAPHTPSLVESAGFCFYLKGSPARKSKEGNRMSRIDGHCAITVEAIRQLKRSQLRALVINGDSHVGVVRFAVLRDIFDIMLLGHWLDYGQQHHFMRRFDGQSQYDAYREGLSWIYGNYRTTVNRLRALLTARGLSYQGTDILASAAAGGVFHTLYKPVANILDEAVQSSFYNASSMASPTWLVPFGNAIHTIQDSFASGHVTRTEPLPGEVIHVHVYDEQNQTTHDNRDKEWRHLTTQQFSESGKQAVAATKHFIELVLTSVLLRPQSYSIEHGWTEYCAKWLKANDKLPVTRERVIPLSQRRPLGIPVKSVQRAATGAAVGGLRR